MVEFNPDGSIKLPGRFAQKKEENKNKLQNERCIKIERRVVSHKAPKKCKLFLTLSQKMSDNRFVSTIHNYFKEYAQTPTKLVKINEKEFEIEVGTDFKRCTECRTLRGRYKEFLHGNMIDKKGNCTFEDVRKNFSYEDYFE